MAENKKQKMLYIDTSVRNPERTRSFIKTLLPFNQKVLTNDVALGVETSLIMNGLYRINDAKIPKKDSYTESEVKKIMIDNPQDHSQGGFRGYASRFSTHYFNMNQSGYVFCEKDQKILIGETGKKLAGLKEEEITKMQMLHLSALAHWQTPNPFSANLSKTTPLSLLLRLIKKNINKEGRGIHKREIPIIMCWNNNNENDLYAYLVKFRGDLSKLPKAPLPNKRQANIDNLVLQYCIDIFGDKWIGLNKKGKLKIAGDTKSKKTILIDYPDSYYRTMRLTNLIIKVREKGETRIVYNKNQQEAVDHVISQYSSIQIFKDKKSYFNYASKIDAKLYKDDYIETLPDKFSLDKWVKEFGIDIIKENLLNLRSRRQIATDEILKDIPGPLRLEWLVALYTHAHCKESRVEPRYSASHDGQPTHHANGESKNFSGVDMIAYEEDAFFNIEVTTITGTKQDSDEIGKIMRHFNSDLKDNPDKSGVCLYIVPTIHEDTIQRLDYINNRKKSPLNIQALSIEDYVSKIEHAKSLAIFA